MNVKSQSSQVLRLIAQAGPSGATSHEISGWSCLALATVETTMKALRRQGVIRCTKRVRLTPEGHETPVYVPEEAS